MEDHNLDELGPSHDEGQDRASAASADETVPVEATPDVAESEAHPS